MSLPFLANFVLSHKLICFAANFAVGELRAAVAFCGIDGRNEHPSYFTAFCYKLLKIVFVQITGFVHNFEPILTFVALFERYLHF